MKKLLYFAIPLLLIFAGTKFYKSRSVSNNGLSQTENCNLSATEFKKADKGGAIIVDVRTQREYEYGHLENAIVLDIYEKDFKEKVGKLDKGKKYFVYCKTGIRSRNAANYMRQSGFSNICELEGGINYLSRAGVELVK